MIPSYLFSDNGGPLTGPLINSFSQQYFLFICLFVCLLLPNRVLENGNRVPKTGKFPGNSKGFIVNSGIDGGVAKNKQVES